MEETQLKFYADRQRHLICLPYSVENLHRMAGELGIKACWYHATPGKAHYDVPKGRLASLLDDARVTIVSSREIINLIKEKG